MSWIVYFWSIFALGLYDNVYSFHDSKIKTSLKCGTWHYYVEHIISTFCLDTSLYFSLYDSMIVFCVFVTEFAQNYSRANLDITYNNTKFLIVLIKTSQWLLYTPSLWYVSYSSGSLDPLFLYKLYNIIINKNINFVMLWF